MQQNGTQVVAISVDNPKKAVALAERIDVHFPILSDPSRETIRRYGVIDEGNDIAWPTMFLVDKEGVIRWRALTDNYTVRATITEVMAALDAS